jgi:hypothetical protein
VGLSNASATTLSNASATNATARPTEREPVNRYSNASATTSLSNATATTNASAIERSTNATAMVLVNRSAKKREYL